MVAGIFILLLLYPANSGEILNPQSIPAVIAANNRIQTPQLLDDFDNEPTKDEDNWIGMDKFWHWALAFTLTGSTYHLVHNQLNIKDPSSAIIAISSTFGFSVLKEFYDLATYGLFSFKDLCYDILGITTGYFVFVMSWK